MRTKSILLGAAVLAAGVATSLAQNVYSVNVVGYVNVPVTNGFYYLLGNPLNATPNNAVSNIIPITDPNFDGSLIYTFKNGHITPVETFNALSLTNGAWSPGTNVINPGTGFFFFASLGATAGTTGTITFAGSVQSNATIILTPGYNLVSSPFPVSLTLEGLGMTEAFAQDGDLIYRYNAPGGHPVNALNDIITYQYQQGWYDGNVIGGGSTNGPSLTVGEGFYYFNNSPADFGSSNYVWIQNFFVQ